MVGRPPVQMGDKGPVEAVHGFWGDRPYPQKSHLTEERFKAITALEAWDTELRLARDPRCAIPALGHLAKYLASGYLGYGAQEHELAIRAMQAASVNSAITVAPKENGNE